MNVHMDQETPAASATAPKHATVDPAMRIADVLQPDAITANTILAHGLRDKRRRERAALITAFAEAMGIDLDIAGQVVAG
jgi:hypothetical protein